MRAQPGSSAAADAYLAYLATPRGRLRAALERRALLAALPALRRPRPLRILDAGCGPAPLGLDLAARGHDVTLMDGDPIALDRALSGAAAHSAAPAGRLRRLDGTLEQLSDAARFDIVLCHHVLEFCAEPATALRAAVGALAPGGAVSIVVPNAAGMALQAYARNGDASGALAALDAGEARAGLSGEHRHAFTPRQALELARACGLRARLHAGIMALAPLRPDRDDDGALEDQEWQLARRDPFRLVGRHLHLLARRAGQRE